MEETRKEKRRERDISNTILLLRRETIDTNDFESAVLTYGSYFEPTIESRISVGGEKRETVFLLAAVPWN